MVDSSEPNIKKLDLALNPSKGFERKEKFKKLKRRYREMFGDLDMDRAYQNLFEILWYSQLPCFDVGNITSENHDELSMLKRCYWKGQRMSCSSVFQTRPTDRGMCCAFNMEKADAILKQSRYTSALSEMQKQDLKYVFENDVSSNETSTGKKDFKTQPGQDKGLRLVLDAHTERVSKSTVYDNFRGFVTSIAGGDKYPLTSRNSFLVRPGKENYVKISAIRVEAEDNTKTIHPLKRKCFFPNEHVLELHQNYSQPNCVLECSLKYARMKMRKANETFGCAPWFYPATDSQYTNICDPWDTRRFQVFMTNVPDSECSSCLPDCRDTLYEFRVSNAPFRYCDHTTLGASSLCDFENRDMNPPIWMKTVQREFQGEKLEVPEYVKPNPSLLTNVRRMIGRPELINDLTLLQKYKTSSKNYDAFEKDIAIVNFYFDQSSTIQFKRNLRMTTTDFISQIGGLLGLGIGFSFISLMEILYFILIRLYINVTESYKIKGRRSNSQRKKTTFNY